MSKAKQGHASAKKARRGSKATPQSPLEMTQAEVEAMSNGGLVAKAVARRLRAQPSPSISSKSSSKPDKAKLSPAPISKAEMAELKKSGVIPSKVRDRIERDSSHEYTVAKRTTVKKAEPTEQPPSKRSY